MKLSQKQQSIFKLTYATTLDLCVHIVSRALCFYGEYPLTAHRTCKTPGGLCPPPPQRVASCQGPSKLMSHSFQSLGVTAHMCGLIGMFRVVLHTPPPLAVLSSSVCALHYFPSSTWATSDCSLCTVPFVTDVSEVFATPHSCMNYFNTI